MTLRKIDVWMLLSILGLMIFGGFNIFGIRPDLLPNYVLFSVIGLVGGLIVSQIPIQYVEQNYKILYIGFIFLLLITLLFGPNVKGAKRWIDLYVFNFQTSEFFKPVFGLTLAALLSSTNKFSPRKLKITFILVGIPMLLVFLQPDLGTVLLFSGVFFTVFYFSGLSSRMLALVISIGLACLPILWSFMKEYQRARIIGFVNPDIDPQGLTYNIKQAIITIGSGQFFGKGLGLGTQTKFRFLPEFQTDFAFASLIEQFGMIGGVIILSLFAVIIFRIVLKIFDYREKPFFYLYLISALTFLLLEITVNIGMNMGMMPVTGIALPFISYGGSSVLSTMLMLGVVLGL